MFGLLEYLSADIVSQGFLDESLPDKMVNLSRSIRGRDSVSRDWAGRHHLSKILPRAIDWGVVLLQSDAKVVIAYEALIPAIELSKQE